MLGIDFGTRVIGLGVFCPGRDPFPLLYGKIIYQNDQQALTELTQIVRDESIDIVVLGLPHFVDGKRSEMTQKVNDFGLALKQQINPVELYFQDETLTTYEAQERMKQSPKFNFQVDPKQIDALCACLILEDFLNNFSA